MTADNVAIEFPQSETMQEDMQDENRSLFITHRLFECLCHLSGHIHHFCMLFLQKQVTRTHPIPLRGRELC